MNIKTLWHKIVKKCQGSAIRGCQIDRTSSVESGSNLVSVRMDRYSFCGYDCEIVNTEIGAFCSIANNVKIGGARHPIDWVSTSPVFYSGRDSVKKKFATFDRDEDKHTVIGSDVWIGANVIIIQGVNIGNGAVIGAGAVVTKNVGDYEIWAGNPAKFIRKRFSDSIIQGLLDSKWWLSSDEQLSKYANSIKDPQAFIKKFEKNKTKGNPLF